MADLPIVVTKAGMIPVSPETIRDQLVTSVATTNPGYTANLPGSMIEDIASTDVAAIVLCDSARVEAVNSLTPRGANAWLLNQLGSVYGVKIGSETRTTVGVVFVGAPGYVIPAGFIVSDGLHQYILSKSGAIGASGSSSPLICEASEIGTWSVPNGTVTAIVSSVPTDVELACTNPFPGMPGASAHTEEVYRSLVIQAGLAASQGMPRFVRAQLTNVTGVIPRLVSVKQRIAGGWQILVGGGDSYEVAQAIMSGLLDPTTLHGSEINVIGITSAVQAHFTTGLDHNYEVGQIFQVEDVIGPTALNGVDLEVVSVTNKREFVADVDTTAMPAYVSGGVLTPNQRNEIISIVDYPDVYQVNYIRPPAQETTIVITWDTNSANFVNSASVAALGGPAVAAYVNSVPVGKPMLTYEIQSIFQAAVSPVLPTNQLTKIDLTFSINGSAEVPITGTGIVAGDPESYFLTAEDGSDIVVVQG